MQSKVCYNLLQVESREKLLFFIGFNRLWLAATLIDFDEIFNVHATDVDLQNVAFKFSLKSRIKKL